MSLTSTAVRAIKVLLEEGRTPQSIKETLQRTFKVAEKDADEAIAAELEKSTQPRPQETIEAPTRASPETLIQGPAAPGKTIQETAAAARRGEEKPRALKASQFPAEPEPAAPAFTSPTTVLESIKKAPRQPTPGPVVDQETKGLELPEDMYTGYKAQPETPEFPEGSLEGLVDSIEVTPGGVSVPPSTQPATQTVQEAVAGTKILESTALVPTPYTPEKLQDDLRIKNQENIVKEAFRKEQQTNRDIAALEKNATKKLLISGLAGLSAGVSSLFKPEDKIKVGQDSFTVVDVQDDGLMLQDDKTGETEEVLFQAPPQEETKQPPAPAPAGEAPEAPTDFNTTLVDSIRANEGTAAALRKIRPSDVIGQSDFGTYKDTLGNYTVGYGHFITPEEYNRNKNYYDNLSQADAEKFLQQDTADALQVASSVPNFDKLNDNQKAALVDFTYNVGGNWQSKFPKLNAAFERGDLNAVANELRNSDYYRQVRNRAERNAAAFGGQQVTAGEVADPIEQAVTAIDKANQVVGARQAVNRKTLAQALQQLGAAEEEIAKLYADNPIPEIKDISNAKREAFQAYRAQANRNDMLAALDRALMAIGQFASAQAAMGTPFVGSYRPTAIDYDAKTQRALQEYKVESDILEEEQATSTKTRAAKVDQLKTLADRIRDARKTAVTVAEKQVQIEEDEVREGQGKVKQIFDLVRQSKQEQAAQKKLELLKTNAAKKQQDAAKKQDDKSQKEARKAQQDVAEYELGIVEQEIEKTKSILKAANSVNFEDDKKFPQQLSALANSLGVTPESLQSGQRIESVGVTPRPKGKTLGVFDEGKQSYLQAAVVPEVQKQVVTQLQSLEQKRSKLESDLKGLLQGTTPTGQEPGPSATVRTPAAPSASQPAESAKVVTKAQIQQEINSGRYKGKTLNEMIPIFKKAGYTVAD